MKQLIQIKMLLAFMVMAASSAIVSSCGDDEEPAKAPTASFTYVADARAVTFTNTSQNATTYSWDFGDGQSSTEANPTHTYEAYGKFTVKLKATGDGGEATSQPDDLTLAKTSEVVIDASVAEWASIDTVAVNVNTGTITKVKVDYDALNIYFYVEGTADLGGFMDLYLNTDNDGATGYTSGWYPEGFGADFLVEGDLSVTRDAEVFAWPAGQPSTLFTDLTKVRVVGAGIIKSSNLITVGSGKALEFSVSRAAFTNLATKFTFAIVDVDGIYIDANGVKSRDITPTWNTLGTSPKDNTAVSKMLEFDLTK